MGWLHSRPKSNSKDDKPKSRIETLDEEDPHRNMPDADSFLVSAFYEAGICKQTGYGAAPLEWPDIRAYSNGRLTEWECLMLKAMSNSYCSEKSQADQQLDRPPPFVENEDEYRQVMRINAAKRFRAAFGSMAKTSTAPTSKL